MHCVKESWNISLGPSGHLVPNDVVSTSMRRNHVAPTLIRRHFTSCVRRGSLERISVTDVIIVPVFVTPKKKGRLFCTSTGIVQDPLLFALMVTGIMPRDASKQTKWHVLHETT